MCSISFKGIFVASSPATAAVSIPAALCRDDGNHPQVVEEQSDPPKVAAQHSCIPGDIFFTAFLSLLWLSVIITWKVLHVLL